ncbi:MAG: sporulation protein YunB [Clostridiales bacterium]|nr:sporulation protein YunB [Clostridiales bacterium]
MKEKKKLNRGRKIIRMAVIILLVAAALFLSLEKNLEAVILDLAHARAEAIAVEYINEAVRGVIKDGVTYGDMMTVQTDTQGRVTLIQANAARMNELATATALRAQEQLESAEAQSVDIPLGAALGIPFFSAMGPKVQVRILPVSAVTAAFSTEFESAGINQSRHKIFLSLETTVRLVIPTGARQAQINSQVLIAESIIVGEVPQSYVNVPEMDDSLNFAIP